jgi:hypothetical protein
MRLLVDEDTASATLITRLLAAGHEVVQLPHGTPDEVVCNEAQRLALPILTVKVGRKDRRDPVGLYHLTIERAPHCGVIGIFRPASGRWLSDSLIVAALARLTAQEQAQPDTALHPNGLTRLNDFFPQP